MAIEHREASPQKRELYKAQAPELIEPKLFPDFHIARDGYALAIQNAAIGAHLAIQEITGGIVDRSEMDKAEILRRTEIVDGAADTGYRYVLVRLPFRSQALDAEGGVKEIDKLGKPMPMTKGDFGSGYLRVTSVSDGVDGTGFAIRANTNAISVAALTTFGGLTAIPNAPDGREMKYYRKLYAPAAFIEDVTLEKSAKQNLESIAKRANIKPYMIEVALMDREANAEMIKESKEFGAIVHTYDKGDLAWGIKAMLSKPEHPIIVMGRGGAPEGSITQIGAKALGAVGQVRPMEDDFATSEDTPIWTAEEYVPGLREHCIVVFSAITDNEVFGMTGVKHVKETANKYYVENLVLDINGPEKFAQVVEYQKAA